jgi:predicted CXXCH cytochrome family protein
MQPANGSTVLGKFEARPFRYAGIESRFFRRGDKFMVATDGPDGALHEYEIAYTLGVLPLQQYLVSFPGGRLQALEIAWDSRPIDEGGQRWFHLFPADKIKSGDPLHWTGLAENWNGMCADCHSTNVRKSYDGSTETFATTYAEMSVGCEACHGPGSRHVAWAQKVDGGQTDGGSNGLVIQLNERKGIAWTRDAATGKPRRERPKTSTVEVEMCARCHSRRGLLHEDHVHGQPVGDDYRVALLDEDLYYVDGQIRGEVYEYGSFLQSRMFAEGVTCGDCHEPHRPGLRGTGNAVCLQCHDENAYQTPRHHFHSADSPGARCVGCHMPSVTYMVIDRRHDHSFRVPRPDQSVRFGVPNTCNACHARRPAAWAARWIEQRYGHTPSGHQRFADALFAVGAAPDAAKLLSSLVSDRSQPAIARATAIERLTQHEGPATFEIIRAALADPNALVRRAATQALAGNDPDTVIALAAPRLDDSERAVRLEAMATVAGLLPELLQSGHRPALERSRAEYLAVQELNADRPDSHLNLAALYTGLQKIDAAEAELRRALAIDPAFAPAAVNLVDLYRVEHRDAEAEPVLREALLRAPEAAALWEALGLLMVRQKRLADALEPFSRAARLSPDNPHYGFLHATALHDLGRADDAIRELGRVLARHPYDRETLAALGAFHREKGHARVALEYAARLQEVAAGGSEAPSRE